MKQQIQNLKGFRDFLPDEKRRRDYVEEKIIEVFELFGFAPIETPTIESADLLLSKYGEETDRLVYTFKDRGDRKVALKYDQTVPTARVLAQYRNQLPKYFRRYQIQNVFRAEKPQKGRFREFTQCDIDIFGSKSEIADAEILACTYYVFKNIGFKNIKLDINDRNMLIKNLSPFATKNVGVSSLIQTVDKIDKIGQKGVTDELIKKGLTRKDALRALEAIQSDGPSSNLTKIIEIAKNLGVDSKSLTFSPTLARGLDYYTGMIFEIKVEGYKAGSLGGGGRYDNLINQLSGVEIPAVGMALGFDRIVEAVAEMGIVSKDIDKEDVLVTVFYEQTLGYSLKIAKKLREDGRKVQVYLGTDKLSAQIKYADKNQIRYVVIAGVDEMQKGSYKFKDMKTGEQIEYRL